VFVLEAADTMNDQTSNRMLKTLEEPLPYVHLILLADDPRVVLPTISSRCQHVRFDAPPVEAIANALARDGVEPGRARACAGLSLGDAGLARWLTGEEGETLREGIEQWMASTIDGELAESPWLRLLELARREGASAAEKTRGAVQAAAEQLPPKERRRHAREGVEAERRADRRRRAGVLDLGLRLAELWLRDAWCIAEGAPQAVHAVDREVSLRAVAAGRERSRLRMGVELAADTRLRLQLNVSEELAFEALSYRLASLLAR
jgi:DNA polymerase-3 subunit delta'